MTAALRHPLKRANKYRAVKTVVDNIKFDSKGEAARYSSLRIMENAQLLTGLRRQVPYPVIVNGEHICSYRADFVYLWRDSTDVDEWTVYVEDFKGVDTPVSKLKRKLVEAIYGIEIKVVRK